MTLTSDKETTGMAFKLLQLEGLWIKDRWRIYSIEDRSQNQTAIRGENALRKLSNYVPVTPSPGFVLP